MPATKNGRHAPGIVTFWPPLGLPSPVSLVSVLGSAVLPVVAVAAVGYALGLTREVSVDTLATVTIYVLAPALVFYSVVTTPIAPGTAARLFAGLLVFVLALGALAEGVGRVLGEPDETRGALVLAATFSNAGNYGIPLSAFAFGALGRSTAVLYIVGQSVLMYTLGAFVAARGGTGQVRSAATQVFRLPLVYALLAAVLVRALGVVPPTGSAVMETIRLTGDSAIPVMLLLLGIQLAEADPGQSVRRTAPATVLKLAVAPVLALGVALLVGLSGTVGKVFVLECATPAAVTPLMLVVEFGGTGEGFSAADYVSGTIFASTLASLATVTGLILLLQSGAVL